MLIEKKLVVVQGTEATKRELGVQIESPMFWGKENQKMNAYAYNFQVSCAEIYEQVRKLKNFDETKTKGNSSVTFFMDRFKILLFAPVNDSKYANKVSEKAKEFDYSHGGGLPARGNGYSTPILYFRPLSYSFQLRNFHRFLKKYDIYIN